MPLPHGAPLLSRISSYPSIMSFLHRRLLPSALGLAIALPASLSALPLRFGSFEGSIDSTLSIGGAWRVQDRDRAFYGITSVGGNPPAPGYQYSVNADDGNLNYNTGLFSAAVKGTHDLELRSGDFGVFVRGSWFYDTEQQDGDRARRPLTDAAKGRVGYDAKLLDAYVVGRFEVGGRKLTVRGGNLVLSWGESTFIQNGINVVNPIDVAKLRVPGSELKEALAPVPMISFSYPISDELTVEGFYQLGWRRTEIDPPGTYFSTNDFAGIGGSRVYLGFGAVPDSAPFGFVPRGPDTKPSDSGQGGIALRYLATALNSTEFGFYFTRYHSRLPVVSARTPSAPISVAYIQARVPVLMGTGLSQAAATAQATQEAFFASAATGQYLIEYPEDISLFGVSFNTDLGTTGISLQGEVSLKTDVPLQADDVELLFAALGAINPAFAANNQLGNYLGQLSTYVPGFRRHDVWQAQMTATKVTSPFLGASQWAIVGELGMTQVPQLPDQSVLRYDGPGSFTSGSQAALIGTGNGTVPVTPAALFADRTSWGYQVAARGDFNNAFMGGNLSTIFAFAHDFRGTTPLPIGNFIQGRKTYTFGLDYVYQNAWVAELRYTLYAGGGAANLIADRDFVSATLKYSF